MKKEMELILNSTHDAMIVVNEESVITIFNKSAERLTKLEAKEVIGKHIEEIIPTTRLPYILKTGESELNQQQRLRDIDIVTNRMPIKDENNNIVGALAVFRPIGEIAKLAEEITDLKRIQALLNSIFDATQDAISVVDENGVGLLINPAYTRLTGYLEKDVIGKACTVDMNEGDSIHLEVLKTREPVRGMRSRVGFNNKDVIVEAAPILVNDELRGSVAVIHDLTEIEQLTNELDQAKKIIRSLEAKYTFDDIIGSSAVLINAMEKGKLAAATPATVILRGESGTGKELFAHAIHNASRRKYSQFVRVNCAAISENLLESELFGYEEGAFTGAIKGGKVGLFERADGGTIFLDEIGEINLRVQSKLLRVLQEKEIIRVGGTKPIPIDVRVISATNVDLEKAVDEGEFRRDLYYRLNVIPIRIPSLRERKDDLKELLDFLLKKFNQEYGRSVVDISEEAMEVVSAYEWPGNVRELENFLGRTMINMRFNDRIVELKHLPKINNMDEEQIDLTFLSETFTDEVIINLQDKMDMYEKKYIEKALKANNYNKTKTAKVLNVSIRSLYYKITKYELEKN